MRKAQTFTLNGSKKKEIELPLIFSTPLRKVLIHKVFINLYSHQFQKQGRHPSAGMDVVARSLDPPTGHGQARIARLRGGGGGRQGEAGGVASTRGGRQAHPPTSNKIIFKKTNKKENKLALCSAIAATGSKEVIESRGHKVNNIESFPIIVSADIEKIDKAKDMNKIFDVLNLSHDIQRLAFKKSSTGISALRGRRTKMGKSVLFVTINTEKLAKACGAFPGVDVRSVSNLSVLDLAPGGEPARLTVYSENAIQEIGKINSSHLALMVKIK